MPFRTEMIPIETERKFLIAMPDINMISKLEGTRIKHIEQTYIEGEDGKNARVRRIEENGAIYFVKTIKQRISTLSSFEDEYEIDLISYERELKNAIKDKKTVTKTRYCVPFASHVLEIDVYPFWQDRAILEIELHREDESFSLPEYINVIKEVSEDPRYKNTNLAKSVPFDEI